MLKIMLTTIVTSDSSYILPVIMELVHNEDLQTFAFTIFGGALLT